MAKHKHWSLNRDNDDIAWLHFDKQDSSSNTLSAEVLQELEQQLDSLHNDIPKGLVILSDKQSGFIAGADINEFTQLHTESEALTVIQHGQSIFNKIESLPCPTLALIKGFCLGGGMELALACQYRIAENSVQTKLGLPEVKLGIHPGFGGCVRAFKRLNPLTAFDIILTGRNLSARAAKKTGLIDYAVPERHLLNAARQTILKPQRKKHIGIVSKVLSHRIVRPWFVNW